MCVCVIFLGEVRASGARTARASGVLLLLPQRQNSAVLDIESYTIMPQTLDTRQTVHFQGSKMNNVQNSYEKSMITHDFCVEQQVSYHRIL